MVKVDITLPTLPNQIFEDLANVQSLSDECGKIMTISTNTGRPVVYPFGEAIHDFIYGWGVGDGEQLINFIEFIDKYGIDPIVPETRKWQFARWYLNEVSEDEDEQIIPDG